LELARQEKVKKLIALLEAPPAATRRGAVRRPAAPAADLPGAWERLEAALGAARPEVAKSLRRGTTEAKLARVGKALGVRLPADVRASYLLHNGQKGRGGLFPEGFADLDADFFLLTVDDVQGEWEKWKELLDDGDLDRPSTPDRGVRADWWNPKWVP